MNIEDQKFLLKLSRESLDYYFKHHDFFNVDENSLSEELKKKYASFVTLTKNDDLRGCIGRLIPEFPVYLDVVKNTHEAAFHDYRFERINEDDFKQCNIEISVLSELEPFYFEKPEELLEYMKKNKPGLYIKSGYESSTYLPSVWEQIPDEVQFITELCVKAGLAGRHWLTKKLDVFTYTVERFSEK